MKKKIKLNDQTLAIYQIDPGNKRHIYLHQVIKFAIIDGEKWGIPEDLIITLICLEEKIEFYTASILLVN